jgi:hypothetical protein
MVERGAQPSAGTSLAELSNSRCGSLIGCYGISGRPFIALDNRQALRLAFLSPDVTSAILEGGQPAGLSLAQFQKLLPLQWEEHRHMVD